MLWILFFTLFGGGLILIILGFLDSRRQKKRDKIDVWVSPEGEAFILWKR